MSYSASSFRSNTSIFKGAAGGAGRALLAALAEPMVSALRVTIPRARQVERLAEESSKCGL